MPSKHQASPPAGPIVTQGITATDLTTNTLTANAAVQAKTTLEVEGWRLSALSSRDGTLKVGTGATYARQCASGAVIQGSSAAAGKGQITVTTETLGFTAGTAANMDNQLKVNGGRSVTYYNAQGGWTGHGAGVYYSATAPANPANGTIWVMP